MLTKSNMRKMRLCVYLLEGRGWTVKNSYVKLQVGKHKSKTRLLKNTENPFWNEEFVFRVHDFEDEMVVSVYKCDDHEQHGVFHAPCGEFAGRVRIPVWSVAAEENQNLPPTWFSIEMPKHVKSTGKLLLALSIHGKHQDNSSESSNLLHRNGKSTPINDAHASIPPSKKTHDGKHLMKALAGRLEKLFTNKDEPSQNENSSELSTPSDYEDFMMEPPNNSTFEELIELAHSKSENKETPDNLPGGVLLDQTCMLSPKDLNMAIFAPNSEFQRNLAELQGTTDVQEEPWKWKSESVSNLRRVVSCTKAATKLFKAVKATEEQTYVNVDDKEFAVLVNVSTPDVPYGNTFKIVLLYKIMPGDVQSSEEESAHLIVSWAIDFYQSTMMKAMIENGARQGLKDSFEQFSTLLSQNFKLIKNADNSDKDHILATMENNHQTDSELAVQYFWNFTVVSSVFMLLYVLVHIFLSQPKLQGLEFDGLDLPDSFGELVACWVLFVQVERVYYKISHFIEARLRRGSDHGVKAHGDGWVLTVALIEGENLASENPTEIPDPYVVFTCNGKTRTSSVKLQTLDPQWSGIASCSCEPLCSCN